MRVDVLAEALGREALRRVLAVDLLVRNKTDEQRVRDHVHDVDEDVS